MAGGIANAVQLRKCPRATNREFAQQVIPFVGDLAGCDGDPGDRSDRTNLGSIEPVAAPGGLVVYCRKVGIDGGARMGVRLESLQLRVMNIASRLPAKHGLGEQGLPPQRNEPLRIQVLRVQRPKTHAVGPDAE